MLVKQKNLLLCIIVFISFLPTESFATEAESPLKPLFQCTTVIENSERLKCMDREIALLNTAQEQQKILVIDEVSAKALKKEAFGFRMPTLPKLAFPKLGTDKSEQKLMADVKRVYHSEGKRFIELDNEQIWEIRHGDGLMPKGDLTVAIKPASLGSYLATISNGRRKLNRLRVRRVQ